MNNIYTLIIAVFLSLNGISQIIPVTNSSDSISCNGTATLGDSIFTVLNPTQWEWPGSTPNNLDTMKTGFCPGEYFVVIHPSMDSIFFTIESDANPEPEPDTTCTMIAFQNTSIDPTNGQCNGEVSVSYVDAVGNVAVEWSTGVFNMDTLNNLCTGSYSAVVTDDNCSQTITFDLVDTSANQEPDTTCTMIAFQNTSIDPTNGQCNGEVSVSYVDAVGFVTVEWSTGVSNMDTLNNLCAGSYSAVVTDDNCSQTITFDLVDTSATPEPDTTCTLLIPSIVVSDSEDGQCNGEIIISYFGAVGNVTVDWSNGISNVDTLDNLCAGSYTVVVSDDNCTVTKTMIVTDQAVSSNDSLEIEIITTNESSAGACDGSVSFNTLSGTVLGIAWSTGDSNTTALKNLCEGIYELIINTPDSQESFLFTIASPASNISNIDSTIVIDDTLVNQPIVNCNIDYSSIDTVVVINHYLLDNTFPTTLIIDWGIISGSDTTFISDSYEVDSSGNIIVVLDLVCDANFRSIDFIKVVVSIVLEDAVVLSQDELIQNMISIYPNPVKDFINVAGIKNFSYTLININGKEVLRGKSGNELNSTLDVSSIKKGTYILNISTDKTSYQIRIMK